MRENTVVSLTILQASIILSNMHISFKRILDVHVSVKTINRIGVGLDHLATLTQGVRGRPNRSGQAAAEPQGEHQQGDERREGPDPHRVSIRKDGDGRDAA